MADTKISALTAATTPLAGTEVLPIVQSSTTKKVSVADLTAGRVISASGGTFKTSTAYGTVSVDNTGTTGGGGYTVKQNGTTCGAFGVSGWVKGDTTSNAALFSETGKSIEVFTNGSATAIGSFTTAGNWAPASGKGIDFSAGGIANAVAYLNGSKQLASFSSNFKFDGTTLDVGASGVNSRFATKAAAGGRAMFAQNSSGANYFYTDNDNAVSTGANGADAVLFINKTTATNRSINAAGTLNANGADYAEYMAKAGDFVIAKGDLCGINADGKLTNVFSDAVSFIVKSTDPSFVGGNAWGSEENIGVVAPEPVVQAEDQSDEDFVPIKAKYDADKAAFDAVLEAARQKVDRVAFAGQVPVNILGAVPGQYIVPIDDGGTIKPSAVDEANMTLTTYMKSVGKVIAIEPDGRAKIIVKTA